jgi:predicted dehydrogenase
MYKAGVIGAGKMGMSHSAILGAHPDIEEVSVCDTSKLLLAAFKKYSKFDCFSDYKEMFQEKNLDLIVIATPTRFHKDMVLYAFNQNCHVFCEKPFTLNIEDSKVLKETAINKKLVNQVGFHNRFIGTFQKVKKIIKKQLIGDIYHINGEAYGPVITQAGVDTWRSNPEEGGGCLLDYASHVINLMQFMVGMPDDTKGTVLKNIYSRKVEDAVYSTLYYDNNITGQLSVNWSEETFRKMSTKIEILGKKGKIVANAQECQLYLKYSPQIDGYKKGWNSFWITDQTEPVWYNLRGEEYSAQIDYFIQSIKNKNIDNINSFNRALMTDRTIEMLRKDAGRINNG